jgi:hypothetical protein
MSGGVIVAAVTAPPGRSLIGKLAGVLAARAKARNGRPSKTAAVIRDHTGTITALGFADTAAWHAGETWGLIATAVAILVAEFKVRG